jgi:hypothetical protein
MTVIDTVECSECGLWLAKSENHGFTCGYYDTSSGQWADYAKPGQTILCDRCMWATEGYQKVYGKVGGDDGVDKTEDILCESYPYEAGA